MRPRQLTALLTFGAAVVLALLAGISIATANYALLIFAATAVIVAILVVMPGYIPLFVFGLLMPFSLPMPFVWNFPFLLIALTICGVKYWLQRGLEGNRRVGPLKAVDFSIALFMAWVFMRYCMKPAVPNVLGFGMNVTGFRSWLNYGLSFGALLCVGRFVGNRAGILKLARWMAYFSILFTIILLSAALSRSQALALLFVELGMFVDRFDTGSLRFVVLPTFGGILFALALLPNLLQFKRVTRWVLVLAGLAAIIIGGNRSSFGTAFVMALAIPFLRRRWIQTVVTAGLIAAVAIGGYLAGPMLSQLPQTGFLRPLALVSPDLAKVTGGDANLEWREIRWQRGLEEIRQHPLVGVGYGGLENAFESDYQTEEESVDMSLAVGGVHNGYIAGALALGIPAALLFIYILLRQTLVSGYRAYRLQRQDPVLAEAHCFVCANLLSFAANIFFGSDLNEHMVWFYFGLSVFVCQLRVREKQRLKAAPSFVQPVLAEQAA